ncbi:MAG: lysine transporter LysE [Hirschia sp.]|nr:lysine transporter LysE [Hirschia sp.]MBF17480.1 lysine transporter LysE [Hirschia sp.]
MELSVWLALILLFLSGGLTPGPAVMLVASSSVKYGFAPAMVAGLGVSVANLAWVGLAASGAAALASQFPMVFTGLKLAGACFILYLAFTMARQAEPVTVTSRTPPRRGALFARGIGLQLSNPNALVFFGGLLPAYFDPDRPLMMQLTIVIATITATELFGLAIYAGAADALSRRFADPSFVRVFNISAAILMAGSALFALYATSQG